MDPKIEILQHTLGLNAYGEGRPHRNHFVASADGPNFHTCRALVADGLMREGPASELTGGMPLFYATDAGIEHVARHSPSRPKRTRSQERYASFLRSDCGISFKDWLLAGH